MDTPIKVAKNTIKFAKEYLGVDEIFVWVGHGFDPQDNEDQSS